MLEPHVVVKAGVSDGERDREEALGRGRDPGSLAERRSGGAAEQRRGGAAARPHSLPQVLALPRLASGYLANAARLRVP